MNRLHDDSNYVRPKDQPPAEPLLQVRERYKEQFEKAMDVVREHLNQVSTLDEMKRYLNDQGYKTRTGKPWTVPILHNEIKKYNLRISYKKDAKAKAYETLKTQYQTQYQDAVKQMAKLYREGVQISAILDALESQGYKTITGKKWTESNIRSTINKFPKQ